MVDTPVDMPGHPLIPSGQYAVQATNTTDQTVLLPADGGPTITVPSNATEVRGAPGSAGLLPNAGAAGDSIEAPMVAAGLDIGLAQSVDESLAIIANLCFSGDGDRPLCLLFEPR